MFETHILNDKGFSEMYKFKSNMHEAVIKILEMMPESREKFIFKTKIDEAVFFGAKAIASKEGNFTEIIEFH